MDGWTVHSSDHLLSLNWKLHICQGHFKNTKELGQKHKTVILTHLIYKDVYKCQVIFILGDVHRPDLHSHTLHSSL